MVDARSVASVYVSLAFTSRGIESKMKSMLNKGIKKADVDDEIGKDVKKGVKKGSKKGTAQMKKDFKKATSGLSKAVKKGVGSGTKGMKKVGVGMGAGILAGLGTTLVGGFKRLSSVESAKSQISGLGKNAEQVATTTDNALKSVQGTSYAVESATNAATLGLAANIKEGKDLENYLTKIADVASVSGSDYNEISQIFGKIAAKGKLSGETLAQFEERGFGAAGALSKYYNKNQEEVRKMITSGKVSSEDFLKAMDQYEGAALKSGDTTKGAIGNMLTSFSRLGATLFGGAFPLFQKFALEVRDVVDGIAVAVKEPMDKITNEMGSSVGEAIKGIGGRFAEFLQSHQSEITKFLLDGWDNVKQIVSNIAETFKNSNISPEQVWTGMLEFLSRLGDAMVLASELAAPLISIISQLGVGVIVTMLETLIKVAEIVIPIISEFADWMSTWSPETMGLVSGILSTVVLIVYTVSAITTVLGPVIGAFGILKGAIGGVSLAAGGIGSAIGGSTAAAGGLTAALGGTVGVVLAVVGAGIALGGAIAWVVEKTIGWYEVFQWIDSAIDWIGEKLSAIPNMFASIADNISNFFGAGIFTTIGVTGSVPAMATGGDVMGPTLALVGEKDPETIVNRGLVNENLQTQTKTIEYLIGREGGGGGQGSIFNIYPSQKMSEEELAKKVYKQLEWEGRGE